MCVGGYITCMIARVEKLDGDFERFRDCQSAVKWPASCTVSRQRDLLRRVLPIPCGKDCFKS